MNTADRSRKNRRWTTEQKSAIVEETRQPGATVSGVARQHGLAPGQLFTWRKQLQTGGISRVSVIADRKPANVYQSALTRLERFEDEIESLVTQAVLRDLKLGNLSGYNSACSLSNIANAICKIQATKLELIEKSRQCPPVRSEPDEDPLADISVREKQAVKRTAQRLVLHLVRTRIAEEAAAKASDQRDPEPSTTEVSVRAIDAGCR